MENEVLLFDKSTLESLSTGETPFLRVLFFPTLVPTLVYEVLADPSKPRIKAAPSNDQPSARAVARR